MYKCVTTKVDSSLTDLYTGSWSPSHVDFCHFKVSVLVSLEWGHQTLSCFGFSTYSYISLFNALWSDRMHGIFSIFLYLLRLSLCPKIWSILEKVHGLLRRMYIVPMLDEIVSRHQLGPFDLWCDLVLEFLYWVFVWMTYQLVKGWY
jgi:hypothetical protein